MLQMHPYSRNQEMCNVVMVLALNFFLSSVNPLIDNYAQYVSRTLLLFDFLTDSLLVAFAGIIVSRHHHCCIHPAWVA
jgi:hypothetical protein